MLVNRFHVVDFLPWLIRIHFRIVDIIFGWKNCLRKKEEKKKSRYLKDLRGRKKKNMRRGENGGRRSGGKNKYMLSRGWKKRRKYWNWQLGVNVCAREKEVIFENSQILSRWERNTPTIIYIYYHTSMAYRSLLVNYFFVLLK